VDDIGRFDETIDGDKLLNACTSCIMHIRMTRLENQNRGNISFLSNKGVALTKLVTNKKNHVTMISAKIIIFLSFSANSVIAFSKSSALKYFSYKAPSQMTGVLPSQTNRLSKLLLWMEEAGVTYDKNLLDFVFEANQNSTITDDQIKIVSKKNICATTKIGRIPKSACLSLKNVPDVQTRVHQFGIEDDDDICLAAAITYEMAIGKKSRWHGYLSSLPKDGEFIPLIWPEDLIEFLPPGDLYDEIAENKRRYTYYWNEHVVPLLTDILGSSAGRRLSLEMFLRAVSFAGSRAFFVDRAHGEALVPLADMFNHKMAFLPADAEVEGASSGSDDDSSIGINEREEQDTEEDSEIDVGEDDMLERGPDREMDMALGSYEGRDWLPVVALRDIAMGEEVRTNSMMQSRMTRWTRYSRLRKASIFSDDEARRSELTSHAGMPGAGIQHLRRVR
jgi:hypothetical protein